MASSEDRYQPSATKKQVNYTNKPNTKERITKEYKKNYTCFANPISHMVILFGKQSSEANKILAGFKSL